MVLLVISFSILLGYFSFLSDLYMVFPYLVGISLVLLSGLGPAIFLYVKSLLKELPFSYKSLLHFIPLIFFLISDYEWFLANKDQKILLVEKYYKGPMNFSWGTFIFLSILLVHLTLYLLVTARMVFKDVKHLLQKQSNASLVKWRFIKIILFAFIAYLFVYILVYLSWSFEYAYTTQIEAYLQLVLSVLVLTFGYYFIKNTQVFIPETVTVAEVVKYKNSKLEINDRRGFADALKHKMETEKYYLNPKLSLKQLAEVVSLTPHQLSQIINQEIGMNFFDFVNSYRIEETKKRLIAPEYSHLSILGIAFECGFNSKGAFNRIFKKFEGISPSAYIKKHRNSGHTL